MNKNKLIGIILLICAVGLFVMSIVDMASSMVSDKMEWKPTEVYEFTNKYIDWD